MAQTKRTTTKANTPKATTPKSTTVKMYNQLMDIYADVHVNEVDNYRKGGYEEAK